MTRPILLRYIIVFIITLVAVGIISEILYLYFQIETGSASSIVPIIVPAMDAGNAYYKKAREIPLTQIKWAYARYFTAIQIVFSIVLLIIAWIFIPELAILASSVGTLIVALFVAVYLVMVFLVSRYFFGFGIKSAAKADNHNK